jgi:hypothetical protein
MSKVSNIIRIKLLQELNYNFVDSDDPFFST